MAVIGKGLGLLGDAGGYISRKAKDLIDEISEFADVDSDGLVSVFHRTTKDNADKIRKSGIFTPKENGIFFSTKRDSGNTSGYGDEVIELKIPADKLELDDIFDGEAHLRLPAKANKPNDVSEFIPNKPLLEPSGLLDTLNAGKNSGEVVTYPDEWIEQVPYELRKEVALHNEGILGSGYREGMEASPTYYRGGGTGRSELKPDTWMSTDPHQASTYAGKYGGGNVMPLKVSKDNVPEVYSNSPEWNRIGLYDSDIKIPANEYPEGLGYTVFGKEPEPWETTDTNILADWASKNGFGGIGIKGLKDVGPYQRGADLTSLVRAESLSLADPSKARSVNAVFDPAKASSSNLLASNPVATAAAGAGGILAMSASDDSDAGIVGAGKKVIGGILGSDLGYKQVSPSNPFLFDFNPNKLTITEEGFKDVGSYKGDASKPITVTKSGDSFIILDGHHRAKIAQQNGDAVRAIVIPDKEVSLMRDKNIHPAEMLKEWVALKAKGSKAGVVGAGLLSGQAQATNIPLNQLYSPSSLGASKGILGDVGGYESPSNEFLASASMGASGLNDRGADDSLLQFIAPRLPSELMNKVAYNDERGILDRIKAAAGLLGFY